MAEENENIIEEVSNETPEQVEQQKVEQPRDEKGQFKSKFESASDDSITKVDLSKPPSIQKSEEVKQEEPVVKEEVDVGEEVKPEAPVETLHDRERYTWTPNYSYENFGNDQMLCIETIPFSDHKVSPLDFTARDGKLVSAAPSVEVRFQKPLENGNLYVELNDYPFVTDPLFTTIYEEGKTYDHQ